MLSFQDILAKTTEQRRQIRESLDHVKGDNGWHPEDSNLYEGLNATDTAEVKAALDSMTLAEVLEKGSTAMGADTLVATKLHDTLIYAARPYDICPEIGYVISKWEGGDLGINITVDGSYMPKPFVGGKLEVNASFVKATVAPVSYGIPIVAGKDVVEDQEYSIIQWHAEKAAAAIGEKASQMAIAVLIAAADGDGTLNGGNSGDAGNTKWTGATTTGIDTAYTQNGTDGFKSNSIITSPTAWMDGIYSTIPAGTVVSGPKRSTFDFNIAGIDLMIWPSDADLTAGGKLLTMVFDSRNAILTGRKRWLEIKNFSNPIEDIAGAVVSFRQDSVTLYKDAISKITET